ncbi:CCA tRNA nucleotidyltransferase [candidate division WOR-3 bacterium]|nr:CCA tRNA nucleotidyltransferase [candidate division WOR-3 bacterium]
MKEMRVKLEPFIPMLMKAREPWLVGGAIRDAILGLPVKDFDFAIKDSAVEFARWFANKIKGTFILLDAKNDEARVVYKGQSSKFKVQKEMIFDFTHMESIKKDLARRDFRMNAIAARLPELGIFDPFMGRKDIERKCISMISLSSLIEDPLRILRGFRFQATLGFKITPNTLRALGDKKDLLSKVAGERIREEFFTLLSSSHSYWTLRQMARVGVLQAIIPETMAMEKVPQGKPGGNLLYHSLLTVKKIEDSRFTIHDSRFTILKLAGLLHDIGKPYCYSEENGKVHFYGHEKKGVELLEGIRERLKLSNNEFKAIQILIQYHMRPHLLAREKTQTEHAIFRLVRDVGKLTPQIFELAYADALASGPRGEKRLLALAKKGIKMWEELKRPKFKRLITGDDLIKLGFTPGPKFKLILEEVEEAQLIGELKTHQEALKFVKEKYD